jgi:hypothetical protein
MHTFENWRKSSRSGGTDNCVEVAWVPGHVGVRDSKDPTGPILDVKATAWRAFVTGVQYGQFDLS